MIKKLLTIIIPVYNTEKYLKRCVESILKQIGDDSEIILVDDGSTDSSVEICDDYQKMYPGIVLTIHKENKGLSSARNIGIEFARGEYIFFLDSDDSVADNFIYGITSKMVNKIYDIIEFECCWEKKYGQYKPKITGKIIELSRKKCIDNIFKNKIGNQICFRVYRKELFENIRFPVGKNYEDISTYYRLLLQADKIVHLQAEYYIYNIINSNSITKSESEKNMRDMYDAVNNLCKGVENFYISENMDLQYVEYYKKNTYIYIVLKLIRKKDSKLKSVIIDYLKQNNKYNLFKFRHYDLKRWGYFELLLLFNKI